MISNSGDYSNMLPSTFVDIDDMTTFFDASVGSTIYHATAQTVLILVLIFILDGKLRLWQLRVTLKSYICFHLWKVRQTVGLKWV